MMSGLLPPQATEPALPSSSTPSRMYASPTKGVTGVMRKAARRSVPIEAAGLAGSTISAGGKAGIEYETARPDHALTSLTRESSSRFWPSPDDIRSDLDEFAPPGKYDSIFVFWPQRNLKNGTAVPCDAWGLAIGASKWTNGATYAAIANAPSFAWTNEARGEVWLHEWLHGVCAHFAQRGHVMPERDADGGELHGYFRSPTAGWTDYYRDLMSGKVLEEGKRLGIPADAWMT